MNTIASAQPGKPLDSLTRRRRSQTRSKRERGEVKRERGGRSKKEEGKENEKGKVGEVGEPAVHLVFFFLSVFLRQKDIFSTRA